jgi:hypothetical protein
MQLKKKIFLQTWDMEMSEQPITKHLNAENMTVDYVNATETYRVMCSVGCDD